MKRKITNAICCRAALALVIIASALLAGCMHLNQFAVERVEGKATAKPSGKFNGLQTELAAAATNNQTLRLLVVHGMGISSPGYSSNLVDRIALALNLKLIDQTNLPARNSALICLRNYGNGASRLCVYELTWSPITTSIKTNQFALDLEPSEISQRQSVNNNLKTNLVDLALSDVVLYAGKYRPALQQPIISAILQMESDSKTNDDPIAIITHSLGSYMVLDTLKTMSETNGASENAQTAESYASRVNQIFMMANQIPMLDLSDRTNFDTETSGRLTAFFKLHEAGGKRPHPKRSRPELQIVALSDPNDLLSFKLRKRDINEEAGQETATGEIMKAYNLTYTVEHWSIVGVFAWPTSAHVNWWTDSRVPQLLAFGHEVTKTSPP
jgi:hypothetical protein